MPSYMFDTNVFNDILDNRIDLFRIQKFGRLFVTHIQYDELAATSNSVRRAQLLQVFEKVNATNAPTETAIYGISRYGGARYSAGNNLYEEIRTKLDNRNKRKRNNAQDALIGETAYKLNCILVTGDSDLREVIAELGGESIMLNDLLQA